jgi:peptidoglycan/LPS O-acetylase OafA/YrhL
MAVVIFHTDQHWLSGGFIGVDIFFVISGFLITRILARELVQTGEINFLNFYAKRIRRLFPALVATVLITLVIVFLLFPPRILEEYFFQSIFSLVSLSNIYFFMQSGYFDSASISKPLLHTWSLSVEEQFYLFWPALMVLGYSKRKFRKRFLIVVGTVFLASLAMSILAAYPNLSASIVEADNNTMEKVRSASFFLSPFRAYEFAIGATLTILPRPNLNKLTLETLFLAGLATILVCCIGFNENAAFPGFVALVPCLATALLIYSGEQSTLAKFFFCNNLAQFIGRVSYSTYLLHWPFTVGLVQLKSTELGVSDKILLIAASVIGGWLLYRLVELPFKGKSRFPFAYPPAGVLVSWSVCIMGLSLILGAVFYDKGHNWRVKPVWQEQARAWRLPREPKIQRDEVSRNLMRLGSGHKSDMIPSVGPTAGRVLIVGDSHAGRLYEFARNLSREYSISTYLHWQPCWIPLKGSRHVRDINVDRNLVSDCSRPERYWNYVKMEKFDAIIIAGRYTGYLEPGRYGNLPRTRSFYVGNDGEIITDPEVGYVHFRKLLEDTVSALTPLTKRLFFIAQPPPPVRHLKSCNLVPYWLASPDGLAARCEGASVSIARERMERHEYIMADVARKHSNVEALLLLNDFCKNTKSTCISYLNKRTLFNDNHHLSRFGADFVFRVKKTQLDKFFGNLK